jgi:hypothetical protein
MCFVPANLVEDPGVEAAGIGRGKVFIISTVSEYIHIGCSGSCEKIKKINLRQGKKRIKKNKEKLAKRFKRQWHDTFSNNFARGLGGMYGTESMKK